MASQPVETTFWTKVQAINKTDQILEQIPFLTALEKKYNVPKVYLVGGIGFLLLITVLQHFAQFLTTALGFAYPAVASILAVESSDPTDDIQWLTYWIVFAVINSTEIITSNIPMYWHLKSVFIVYLFAPQTLGAKYLYLQYIQPWLKQRQGTIDEKLKAGQEQVESKLKQGQTSVQSAMLNPKLE